MRVTWLDFHHHDKDWVPDEPWDCELWVTADIGDENGSWSFQIHVCTYTSLVRLSKPKHCFLVDEYLGPEQLTDRLNKFIAAITKSTPGDPYGELARIWLWEYGKYDQRGRLIG